MSLLQSDACRLCPRRCGVDRAGGGLGFCRSGPELAAASVTVHRGEEPVLGGGAVINLFMGHCTLRCAYCQNWQISRNDSNREWLDRDGVVERLFALLEEGFHTVGFVSPTHQLPAVCDLIKQIKHNGFDPVLVYNSSGYDDPQVLRELDGVFDIYLPDYKYADPHAAARWSAAGDYPVAALRALREMFRQKGSSLELDDEGRAVNGMIIRHLVLPGMVDNSLQVLQNIAEELSPALHISLMRQYAPAGPDPLPPPLDRPLSTREWEKVTGQFRQLGFYRGWVQSADAAVHYRPDFDRDLPFSS